MKIDVGGQFTRDHRVTQFATFSASSKAQKYPMGLTIGVLSTVGESS